MKLGRLMLITIVAGSMALTTACPRRDTTVVDHTTTDTAYTGTATPANGVGTPANGTGFGTTGDGDRWISSVRLGSQLNQEGGVPLGQASSTYNVGEPVHVAMEVDRVPANGQVRVVWFGPTNEQIGEDTRQVMQADRVINFAAPAEAISQPGQYRVEVYANNQLVQTDNFTVEAR
jgi:hypothetical protein